MKSTCASKFVTAALYINMILYFVVESDFVSEKKLLSLECIQYWLPVVHIESSKEIGNLAIAEAV